MATPTPTPAPTPNLLGAPKAEAQGVGARRAAAAEGGAEGGAAEEEDAEDAPVGAALLAAGAPVTGGDKGSGR